MRRFLDFLERAKLHGELEALRWLQDKHGHAAVMP